MAEPENNVSVGAVDGLNGQIRAIQRHAYELHDVEHLRLKILPRTATGLKCPETNHSTFCSEDGFEDNWNCACIEHRLARRFPPLTQLGARR